MVPLTNPLSSVNKKYLSLLLHTTRDLEIDRYHYAVLLIGEHEDHFTQKALTELLQVDKSYTVTIVDYLSQHGYVVREKNVHDKREQILKLTAKAQKAIPKIRAAIDQLNNQAFNSLTPEQVKIFNHVLNVVQQNLSNTLDLNSNPNTTQ